MNSSKRTAQIIAQEMFMLCIDSGVNTSVTEIQTRAKRTERRINGQDMAHREAAEFLNINPETLHRWRKAGKIRGFPKNPEARSKPRWLYQRSDVVALATSRTGVLFSEKRH